MHDELCTCIFDFVRRYFELRNKVKNKEYNKGNNKVKNKEYNTIRNITTLQLQ